MTERSSEQTIFLNAIELGSTSERSDYLDEACGGDAALRAEVEALLGAHERLGNPRAGSDTTTAAADPPAADLPGAAIGPYKLLQQIGEGGMGTVYMAEQSHPVRRRVALKVIKAGMDSRQVVARFEAERQALALMDHVNIARVLDAGATTSGLPYFVMELVHGVPITQYCDDNRLTPRQRLELFVPVCRAIQHAHQKGIIHRDLKPSNVLVTLYDGKPVPKVIDFGVAKATEQRLTERTLFTQYGTLVGTLEYMSPEQAEMSALGVDTRSDVYSLGVLLYELLTGSTPLTHRRMKDTAFGEILRLIREEEPARPSARLSESGDALASIAALRHTEPARMAKLMRGELDWIVMKSLEKDRDRRYETANGLAQDLQRHLADEPVQACPPSARYRLRKFVRRNKGPALAASLVLLALVAGVVGTTLGLIRAEQQRRIAQGNEQKAVAAAEAEKRAKQSAEEREAETGAVLEFVEDKVFAAARPQGQAGGLGWDVTLRRAVEAALPFVDQGFREQPLIEARLRMTLGTTFGNLGEAEIAADQTRRARTIYSQQLGPDDPKTLAAMRNLALCYEDLGRHADALELHEETLALMRARLGPEHPLTLGGMNNLANCYADAGRRDEALELREETLAIRRAKLGPDHPLTLGNMNNLALSYAAFGRHDEALKLCQEALRLQNAGHSSDHRSTINIMNSLALIYDGLGRHDEALKLYRETLAIRRAKLGPDHPLTLTNMEDIAAILIELGRGAEAVPIIDRCVTLAAGRAVPPPLIRSVMDLRLRHFAEAGDAAGCRTTAEMWEKLGRTDASDLYGASGYRAVTAAVVGIDPKTPGTDATKLAAEQADRAMTWLHKAVAAGFMDVEHLKRDRALDALRDREDFKELLAELQAEVK